jgi:hypothetical protein
MVAYASVDDLEDFLDDDPTPAHPERLLDAASAEVDNLLRGCVYTVDPVTGLPDEDEDVTKLRDLTVLQAVWMAQDETGERAQYSEIRTSSVTVVRAGKGGGSRYAPRAVAYLQAHGWPGTGLLVRR